jgi:hypothetical protein
VYIPPRTPQLKRGGRFVPLRGHHARAREAQVRRRCEAIARARAAAAEEALRRERAKAARWSPFKFRLLAGPEWLTGQGAARDGAAAGQHVAGPAR